MATGTRTDPYRAFNFRVEIDGLNIGSFSEASGLTADGDSVDYREGTDARNTVRKLMGMRKFSNILNGVPDRRSGTIVLMDEAHKDVLRWNITDAWINKIEGPSLKASGNDIAIESLDLVHEGISLELA
jgi:hypothetical protein